MPSPSLSSLLYGKRVSPRASRRGATDDDKPWRAFTAGSKAKHQRASKGTDVKVRAKTGYDPEQLDVVWEQIKDKLPRPERGYDNTKAMVFIVYMFIHVAPQINNLETLFTPTTGFIRHGTFYNRVIPVLKVIAENIDLIRWENRLRNDNHVLHFPKFVTGIVDCGKFFGRISSIVMSLTFPMLCSTREDPLPTKKQTSSPGVPV